MANTYVLNENNEKYKLSCDIEEFKRFGVGIYLMFKFLKKVTMVLGILTIISIVNVLILQIS